MTVEGEVSAGIPVDRGGTNMNAATLQAGLEALPNVDPGLTVTKPDGIDSQNLTVEFSGGFNAGRPWALMVGRAIEDTDGVVSVTRKQKGKKPGEPVMSATRGWPAVGRYVQQRLILGGFKSRPKSFIMSNVGEVFNLDTERVGPTAARLYDIDDDDTNVIRDITVGRALQLFTDGSVWMMEFDVLDADKTPILIKSDSPGISKNVRPTSIDNQQFYVQRGGETLRSMVFNEIEQNWLADNASVISASLMHDPVDSALRRAILGNDADMLFLPLENGDMLAITLMRTQEVSGFVTQRTAGLIKSIAVDAEEIAWLIVQRNVQDFQRNCFERMEPAKVLDGALEVDYGSQVSLLTNLIKYKNQTVHVFGDDDWLGQFLVSDTGTIDISPETARFVRVGYWIAPYALDVPFYPQEEQKYPMAAMKRVFAVEFSLLDTTSFAIYANGDKIRNVPLVHLDTDEADTPLTLLPFTGRRRLEGLPGFTATAQLGITQVFPGRMTCRSITKEIVA
jgi:hypothetical protein